MKSDRGNDNNNGVLFRLLTRPDIPSRMRKQIEEMHGYNLHLVIQKQLVDSDVNKDEGRLFLPINRLLFDFTTDKERELLNNNNPNQETNYMEVKILDEGQRETPIFLTKCKIESQDLYCLTTHWNSFVDTNALKRGQVIQLWSFRRVRLVDSDNATFTSDLYFALNKLDVPSFL